MNFYIKSFSRAIWDSDLIASRLTLCIAEFSWAIMLLWAGDTFSRPTYAVMARVASEELFSLVFLMSAIVQLSIVLMEDFKSHFARYFSAFNAALWFFVVVSMLLSVDPPPAAIGGEIALMVSAIWIWARPAFLLKGYESAIAAARS